MPLQLCEDVRVADWITHSALPWHRLVCFGPAGFAAYARLRLLPDPIRPGQSENDVQAEDWRGGQVPTLFEVLAGHTATADDCYVCIWDGWGHADPTTHDGVGRVDPTTHDGVGRVDPTTHDGVGRVDPAPADSRIGAAAARPGLAPATGPASEPAPVAKVVLPHREFWLFRGPLSSIGTAQARTGPARLDEERPALVWPADRGWCFAQDVDPHWAGIGGSARLIDQLVADPRLDVVPADPSAPQPAYR